MKNSVVLDTSVFMNDLSKIEQNFSNYSFIIPTTVADELDKLKDDYDFDKNIKARKALHFIENNLSSFIFENTEKITNNTIKLNFTENNDARILNCCIEKGYALATYDLGLKLKAKSIGVPIVELQAKQNDYKGYVIAEFDMEDLDKWYGQGIKENKFGLAVNEYLIIKDKIQNTIIDVVKWTEKGFVKILNKRLESSDFGKVVLLDVFQKCAVDSFFSNQVTLIKGKPGSGKTFLTLAYVFHQLEKQNYERLVIFTNPVNTLHSVKLGFYPGTRTDKLLDTSCGNILLSKIRDINKIYKMLEQQKLIIIPFSDIRGFDTSGMKAIVWIQEAQNLDVNLMKIALQRIGNDCQVIIDGDYHAQVDDKVFMLNKGMKKVSEVFRGKNFWDK